MRYTSLLLLLISLSAAGQSKKSMPHTSTPTGSALHSRKAPPNVQKKFPFNESARVLLLSFDNPFTDPGIITIDDTRMHNISPVKDSSLSNTLGHKRVHEVIALNTKQAEKAAALFYQSACREGTITEYGCYFPRNAIVFLDSSAHIIAELEICFECNGYTMRPKPFPLGRLSTCRYEEFRQFFINAGIKYGVTD